MDTVEIVIYLAVAVLVGGMILAVTAELASPGTYETVKGLFGESSQGYETVGNETLPAFLFSVWEECGQGARDHAVTFSYEGAPTSEAAVFEEVKRLRLCRTLSSAEHGCGTREDLVMPDPLGTGVYEARCEPAQQALIVE